MGQNVGKARFYIDNLIIGNRVHERIILFLDLIIGSFSPWYNTAISLNKKENLGKERFYMYSLRIGREYKNGSSQVSEDGRRYWKRKTLYRPLKDWK